MTTWTIHLALPRDPGELNAIIDGPRIDGHMPAVQVVPVEQLAAVEAELADAQARLATLTTTTTA